MGYSTAEEVTLPTRFLTTIAHFVVVLTIAYDISSAASASSTANGDEFDSVKSKLRGLVFTAIATLAAELILLFLGITIFFRSVTVVHILLHFVGTVTMALFYVRHWSIESFIGLFTAFNALPFVLEVLALLFVLKFSFVRY